MGACRTCGESAGLLSRECENCLLERQKRSDLKRLQGVRRKREKERQLLNLKLRELLRILIKDFLAIYIDRIM